jgi:quinol monooxygenase YgiN
VLFLKHLQMMKTQLIFLSLLVACLSIGGTAHAQLSAIPAQEVALVVNFKVKPGQVETFKKQWQKSVYWSRPEPGCITFSINQVLNDSLSFVLYEEWESQQALDLHFGQPYTKELFQVFEKTLDRPLAESLVFVTNLYPNKADRIRKHISN